MTLSPGTRLGPYEIRSPLGAGGMGEVWRARDPRLNREVAIKVLPEEFFEDEERRLRFEREARTLASLNHPGIAAIHSFEEISGSSPSSTRHLLVMELVEGEDLGQRLVAGPLAPEESLPIARQIAEALEAAHEKGIVHRDLKPANVKVTPEGRVKLLDFGLAKIFEGEGDSSKVGSAGGVTQSPTLTARATAAGIILGTAAYMSPEQARGKPVDKRVDVWAFGCVLFEMLTGKRAFEGETVSDTLVSVLSKDPDWAALPEQTPGKIRDLLRRCLRREVKQRLHDIADARLELEELAATVSSAGQSPFEANTTVPGATLGRSGRAMSARGSKNLWTLLPWGIAAAFAAAAGVLAVRARTPQAAPAVLRKFDLAVPTLDIDWFSAPTLSPDGSHIAYSAGNRIWVRDLDRLGVRSIADVSALTALCWSPDSSAVVYGDRKKLWRVSASGGTATSIADIPGTGGIIGAAWSPSGRIAFSVWRGGLYEVPAQGGNPTLVLEPDAARVIDFHFPSWLPNDDLLYLIHWKIASSEGGRPPDYLAVFDGSRHLPLHLDVGNTQSAPAFVQGHLLYLRQGANAGIWAVPYDVKRRQASGESFPLAPGALSLSASADGSLLYVPQSGFEVVSEMTWVDRSGKTGNVVGPGHAGLTQPSLSPNGRRIVFVAGPPKSRYLWVHDLDRGTETRITFGGDEGFAPVWLSPSRIAYVERAAATAGVGLRLVALNADGSGGQQVLAPPAASLGVSSFPMTPAPDGRHVVGIVDDKGRGRLRVADRQADGTVGPWRPILRIQPEPAVAEARVSPDGRLLAYVTDEPGQPEMFLTRFPNGEGRWQVGTQSAMSPRWARDTGELFFLTGFSDAPSVVKVNPAVDPPFASAPESLGITLSGSGGQRLSFSGDSFDVTADGRRFLIVRPAAAGATPRMVLVQNWLAEFQKK